MCRLCERYQEGASMRDLAKRYRWGRDAIADHLRRYGVPIRPPGPRPKDREQR
jgi:transcriptional regulator of aromatic amino acid metabolism